MKTFKTTECVDRLSSFLIAYGYPFTFDGICIEFTAMENGKLFQKMKKIDPYLYDRLHKI